MKKLWGGRFQKTPEKWVDEFGASIHFDKTLVKEDIAGSLAHASMLEKCGILTEAEAVKIKEGLTSLLHKAEKNELDFSVDCEDIHLNLEKMLIDEIGPLGGKLHTARSRNDQVATDMHLYLKGHTEHIIEPDYGFSTRYDRKSGRTRGDDTAGIHPFAAGPADLVRASFAGLLLDAGAR